MARSKLILLSNFYGAYLDTRDIDSSVVVNNAGIEQLVSLGMILHSLHVPVFLFVMI